MPVVKRPLRGEERLWIDRLFVRSDGSTLRYRRVAKSNTERGARAEEQALTEHWERFGELPTDKSKAEPERAPSNKVAKSDHRWEDAVDYFKNNSLPAKKETTRRGYLAALEGPWFRHWDKALLSTITYRSIQSWDLRMKEGECADSTRRNHHIVLRSVLKSVGPIADEPGVLIDALPNLPPLPRVGKTAVVATTPEELVQLLAKVKNKGQRVAIALAAFAGMRAGEIRALTRGDIDLRAKPPTILISKSRGVEIVDSTKSGDERLIPVNAALLAILTPALKGLKDHDLVSTNSDGNVWNSDVLSLAYRRWAKRLGLKSTRFHSLRHQFATQLFVAAKADANTVRELLGHKDLKTTQRYAHSNAENRLAAVSALQLPNGVE